MPGKIEFAFGYLVNDYPQHCDDFYEFHIITAGEGTLDRGTESVQLKPGRMLISPPGEVHSVSISKELVFTILRVHDADTSVSFFDDLCVESWRQKGFVIDLFHLYQIDRLKGLCGADPEADMAAWFGLLSLLHEIRSVRNLNRRTDGRLQKTVRYMELNISRRLTIDELAMLVNMTSSGFAHLFKNVIGSSPMEYFQQIKIDAAGYLLLQSNLTNKELASRFSFSDEYHFSKVFKKKTGLSPREFRQKNR